jgi:hypothetical protein
MILIAATLFLTPLLSPLSLFIHPALIPLMILGLA